MGAYIFFGIFAIAGLAAFIGTSYSPVLFWLQNGYWNESPKQILFGIIFLITHGGVGFGGLLYLWLKPDGHTDIENTQSDQPWLSKTYWVNATIYSNTGSSKTALKYVIRYLGVISLIVLFVVYESFKRQEYIAFWGLIIPVVTVLIYLYLKKLSRETQIYGRMPLTLNPYPGSIGGQLGGTIPINIEHYDIQKSAVELHCTGYTKSGDDNRQDIRWNETMVPSLKNTINGQELAFCFDLNNDKNDLPESQASESRPYHAWTMFLEITLKDGSILKRKYEDLPVFKTHQKSTIRDQQAYASHSTETAEMHDEALDNIMAFKSADNGGYHLNYPMGRSLWGFAGILFGLVFIVVGTLIPDIIFNIVFPLAGGGVVIGSIYSLVNSLDIHIDPLGLSSKRYVFGILTKERKFASYEIQEFFWKRSMSTSTNSKTTQYYDIYARNNNGQEAIVVESIKGMGQARVAIQRLQEMLRIDLLSHANPPAATSENNIKKV